MPRSPYQSARYLRRFTDLTALFDILVRHRVTLLDPQSWDDKNDAYFMDAYRKASDWKTIRVLCLTQAEESYHHWRAFASGPAGVCIRFKRDPLLQAAERMTGVRHGPVVYVKLAEMRTKQASRDVLPFRKRIGFKSESEYRIIYASGVVLDEPVHIPVQLDWIDRITLSPWLPHALRDSVQDAICRIDGCERIDLVRSTLIGNDEWREAGDRLAARPPKPAWQERSGGGSKNRS